MAEEQQPTLEQTKQLNRSLTEKVLDRACSDPQWKQRLLDDPEAAMREAGFPEAEKLQEIHQSSRPPASEGGEEVRGQFWPGGGGGGGGGGYGYCPWYCYYHTYYWDRPWWSWYGGGGGW